MIMSQPTTTTMTTAAMRTDELSLWWCCLLRHYTILYETTTIDTSIILVPPSLLPQNQPMRAPGCVLNDCCNMGNFIAQIMIRICAKDGGANLG
jgi:hypothetical protein